MTDADKKQITKLIKQVSKGDEKSLVLLYKLVAPKMLSVAKSVTYQHQLAEDAVQEAMIKVVRYAKSFNKGDNGLSWILTITRNEAITIVKKHKPPDANIDDFYSLSDPNVKSHESIELKLAFEKLELNDKRLIYYKYMLDYTVREIAQILNVPKSTVSYNILKAEEKLKKLIT